MRKTIKVVTRAKTKTLAGKLWGSQRWDEDSFHNPFHLLHNDALCGGFLIRALRISATGSAYRVQPTLRVVSLCADGMHQGLQDASR